MRSCSDWQRGGYGTILTDSSVNDLIATNAWKRRMCCYRHSGALALAIEDRIDAGLLDTTHIERTRNLGSKPCSASLGLTSTLTGQLAQRRYRLVLRSVACVNGAMRTESLPDPIGCAAR